MLRGEGGEVFGFSQISFARPTNEIRLIEEQLAFMSLIYDQG